MHITSDLIIEKIQPIIQIWIREKRNLLENSHFTDYINTNFFFHITGKSKSIGDYIIGAIDNELCVFDKHIIEARIFPEIINIVLKAKDWQRRKSLYDGVDFGFERNGKLHLVAMETPDSSEWGFEDLFRGIRHRIGLNFVPIVGSYYGTETYEDSEDFLYFSGKRFWSLISGDEELSSIVIKVVEEICQVVRIELSQEYGCAVNRIIRDVVVKFCDEDGAILWEKIAYSDLPSKPNYVY